MLGYVSAEFATGKIIRFLVLRKHPVSDPQYCRMVELKTRIQPAYRCPLNINLDAGEFIGYRYMLGTYAIRRLTRSLSGSISC